MSTHAGYIAAAYGFTAIVVVVLVGWSLAQYRASRQALADLESRLGRGD